MASSLFLITGGGTGAKVAEAFVHLCAAGLGPDEAHVLLVDADTDNGNLARAADAARAYSAMARWPWQIDATVGGTFGFGKEHVGARPFATKLHVHRLTQPVETAMQGGIRNAAAAKPQLERVLDLFYDESEQEADCTDGFRARPNLGCLLMAGHLESRLTKEAGPRAFLEALAAATSAAGPEPVPVVVAASVFGGTGASLLPVVRRRVGQALQNLGKQVAPGQLRWSAVKLLPHYQPKQRAASVDPDRFLLDTASALQFYSASYGANGAAAEADGRYDAVYVVGSDRPSRNRVTVALGKSGQANPAYVEELVGALAVLDAAGPGKSGKTIRVLHSDADAGGLAWRHLPGGNAVRDRLGSLLHLAALFFRRGNGGQLTYGLRQMLLDTPPDDLQHFKWYRELLDGWACHFDAYKGAPKADRPRVLLDENRLGENSPKALLRPAADYFGRLLLWAETALIHGPDLALADHDAAADYATVYTEMERLKAAAVDTVQEAHGTRQVPPEEDNGLARLLRAALAAMLLQQQSGKGGFSLFSPQTGRVPLAVTRDQVLRVLEQENLGRIEEAFTKTMPAPQAGPASRLTRTS